MSTLDRLEELLADRALGCLEPAESGELDALLDSHSDFDADALDRAAAALDLALGPVEFEPLPAALRERLAATGEAWSAGQASGAPAARPTPAPAPGPRPASAVPPTSGVPAASGGFAIGWWAAAAALVLALVGWWPRLAGGASQDPDVPVAALPEPTVAELRAELLASADVIQVDWTATDFAEGASGDVVWSQERQAGYMRFAGLAQNDPSETQYQLWIFDDEQEHPVDGGVFDISAGGELLIPIDAKLAVAKPTLFAITIEKPGGVVVSDQERIALVGQI